MTIFNPPTLITLLTALFLPAALLNQGRLAQRMSPMRAEPVRLGRQRQ
jgi:hypothetical protein